MYNDTFEIGTFAKACGMTKAALMHYEQLGLFIPDHIGENGYRYYTEDQIYRAEAITLLRYLDLSLSDINEFLSFRSRKKNLETLQKKLDDVEENLFRYEQIKRLLQTTIENMEEEDSIHLDEPWLEEQVSPIYLYTFPSSQRDGTVTQHLPVLRDYIKKCRMTYNTSNMAIGEIVLNKDIQNNSFRKTYGCYRLEQASSDENCYERPAGYYLNMYHRGESTNLPDIYRKLKRYAVQNGYEVINDAYEEDFSTVISEGDHSNFILKVSFQVRLPKNS